MVVFLFKEFIGSDVWILVSSLEVDIDSEICLECEIDYMGITSESEITLLWILEEIECRVGDVPSDRGVGRSASALNAAVHKVVSYIDTC